MQVVLDVAETNLSHHVKHVQYGQNKRQIRQQYSQIDENKLCVINKVDYK